MGQVEAHLHTVGIRHVEVVAICLSICSRHTAGYRGYSKHATKRRKNAVHKHGTEKRFNHQLIKHYPAMIVHTMYTATKTASRIRRNPIEKP
jgi:hypothetical protein